MGWGGGGGGEREIAAEINRQNTNNSLTHAVDLQLHKLNPYMSLPQPIYQVAALRAGSFFGELGLMLDQGN